MTEGLPRAPVMTEGLPGAPVMRESESRAPVMRETESRASVMTEGKPARSCCIPPVQTGGVVWPIPCQYSAIGS
jgi:hypothetical protein